jgi:hypothetical protein
MMLINPCICRMWCFGVGEALQRLVANPEVLHHLKARTARTDKELGTFFNSPQYRQLNWDTGGALDNHELITVLLSIGGDGVQLLNWGNRTATVIGLKCEDLPPNLVQKGLAVMPLIVVEGVQEPAVLNHVLEPVADFFVKHAPFRNEKGGTLPKSTVLTPAHAPA